jgi:hypothetical protein
MTPEELAVWEPRSDAEIMAAEQFKRACHPNAKQTLSYADESPTGLMAQSFIKSRKGSFRNS